MPENREVAGAANADAALNGGTISDHDSLGADAPLNIAFARTAAQHILNQGDREFLEDVVLDGAPR